MASIDETAVVTPPISAASRARGERLRQRLLPHYDVEISSSDITWPGSRPKHASFVRVDRSVCRHTAIKRVPGADFLGERKAIRLKAAASSPFRSSDHAILWGKDRVSVFHWDRERIIADLRNAGITATRDTVMMPSSFFETQGHGVELRNHAHGAELQVWHDGAIVVSRWLRRAPGPGEVQGLVEAMDLGLETTAPLIRQVDRSPTPIRLSWRNLPEYALLFRPHFVRLAVAANIALASFALGGVAVAAIQSAELVRRKAAITPEEHQVLEARKQAVSQARWITSYEDVRGPRLHLSLMEAFFDAIAPFAERLRLEAWEYDSGKLAVTFKFSGELDLPKLVKALESQSLFKGVNSETNALQQSIRLTMTVVLGGRS